MSAPSPDRNIADINAVLAAAAGSNAVGAAADGTHWEGTGLTPELVSQVAAKVEAFPRKQQPIFQYPEHLDPNEMLEYEKKQHVEFFQTEMKKALAPYDEFLRQEANTSVDKLFETRVGGYPKVKSSWFKYPKNTNDVVKYVKRSIAGKGWIRCRGSGHSYPMNNTANQPYHIMTAYKGPNITISLSKINYVNIDQATKTCRVGAGCYLGLNPADPSSTWANSLLLQLDNAGLALPVLGGISHQAVAGFILTGSAGGSLYHATSDMVIGFTFVDGQGNIQTCSEKENPDWFHAMGVSMGLLGIVTEVHLQCVDKFNIIEEYHVKTVTPGWFDPKSPDSAVQQLQSNEYMRYNWWPQNMPNKELIEIWKARKMTPEDYQQWGLDPNKFVPKPWLQFPDTWMGSVEKAAASLFLNLMNAFPYNSWFFVHIIGPVLCALQPSFLTDPGPLPKDYTFWDNWYEGLPMDNRTDPDTLFSSYWCETWLTPEQAPAAMTALNNWFIKEGISATGPYEWEVYAAKKSKFWMSPSYDGDKIRFDILWLHAWTRPNADPKTSGWYPAIWNILSQFNFQPHWGKYIPDANGPQGTLYMKNNFSMWDKFLQVRDQLDPNQIFVCDYWRAQFAIPPRN